MSPKIEVIGDVEQTSIYIPWAKQQWLLREGHWYKHVGDCLIEFSRMGEVGYIRLILDNKPQGFVTHPRSGTESVFSFEGGETRVGVLSGGWDEEKQYAEITPIEYFPFNDDIKGNAVYDVDKPQAEYASVKYGNLSWSNEDSTTILSWKGTPSRHFAIPNSVAIPTFYQIDDVSPSVFGDVIGYTCFGPNVYSSGEVLATLPTYPWELGQGWVLGVGASEQYLYVICYENRRHCPGYEFRIERNSEFIRLIYAADKGAATAQLESGEEIASETMLGTFGYPTVVYRLGGLIQGWTRMAQFESGRLGLPYFFDIQGLVATSSLGHKITINGDEVTYVANSFPKCVWNKSYNDSAVFIDSIYNWYGSPIARHETINKLMIAVNSSSTVESTGISEITKQLFDIVRTGVPMDHGVNYGVSIVAGEQPAAVASIYTTAEPVTEPVCSWEYSLDGMDTDSSAWELAQEDCGNPGTGIRLLGWNSCGEFNWTAISDTGLSGSQTFTNYNYITVDTQRAKASDGVSDCGCLNATTAVYSKGTASGRIQYVYETITVGGEFVDEYDLKPGGAYRHEVTTWTQTYGPGNCDGSNNQYCYGGTHARHLVDSYPPDKPPLSVAFIERGGKIYRASCGGPGAIGACGAPGLPNCETIIVSSGDGWYDEQYYTVGALVTGNGCDGTSLICIPYPDGSSSYSHNGGFHLQIDGGQCQYLGTLPDTVYDEDGNQISLPALGANQKRMICELNTQVCNI